MAPKIPYQGKHREFGILQKNMENTGNFVCSNFKFPDSKDSGYCVIYSEISNCYRGNLQSDGENTGKVIGDLQIGFEWGLFSDFN